MKKKKKTSHEPRLRPKHIKTEKNIYPMDFLNRKMWCSTVWREGETVEVKTGSGEVSAVSVTFTSFGDDAASDERRTMVTTAFDGRVVKAVWELWIAGNTETTVERIYRQMGNRGRPSENQRARIVAVLDKMSPVLVCIDAYKEAAAYDNNKYSFFYEGSLLPIKRDGATITILAEPPTMAFADKRGHLTTRPMKLLQTPGSHTETTIRTENYILYRIWCGKRKLRGEGAKDDKLVIRIKTLLKETGVSERQRDSVKDGNGKTIGTRFSVMLGRILAHFQQCGEFVDFSVAEDMITIKFESPVSKS